MFYSQADEAGFFHALKSIKGVRGIKGRGEDLFLTVPSRLSEVSLRDLLGVFRRYGIDMRQLAAFRSAGNEGWFCDPGAWWLSGFLARSALGVVRRVLWNKSAGLATRPYRGFSSACA